MTIDERLLLAKKRKPHPEQVWARRTTMEKLIRRLKRNDELTPNVKRILENELLRRRIGHLDGRVMAHEP